MKNSFSYTNSHECAQPRNFINLERETEMNPLMYECIENCDYALDMITDEELDIMANDILLLSEGYADIDYIDAFLLEE